MLHVRPTIESATSCQVGNRVSDFSCHTRRNRWRRRKGSVELEAVLITGLMFPLAVALYYMAIRGFGLLYKLIAGILEWPYL